MGRFITGWGAAFAAISCLKLTAIWFPPRRFAFLSGLMMTVAMLGAVGGQRPLALLIQWYGWRGALYILSGVGVVLAGIFWLVVRNDNPLSGLHDALAEEPPYSSFFQGIKRIVSQKQCWLLSLYSGLSFSPVTMFGGLWGVPFLRTIQPGLSVGEAGGLVSLIFIGFAVGCPCLGYLASWIRRRKLILSLSSGVGLLTISAAIYIPGLSQKLLVILLFGFGFSISGFLLSFTMIREINALAYAATALGFMNAFNAIIGASADPFAGKILDLVWSGHVEAGVRIFSASNFRYAFAIIPLYLILSLVLLIFVKDKHGLPPLPGRR